MTSGPRALAVALALGLLATACGTRVEDATFDALAAGGTAVSEGGGAVAIAERGTPATGATTAPTDPGGDGAPVRQATPTAGGEAAPADEAAPPTGGGSSPSAARNRASDTGVTPTRIRVGNITSKGGPLGPNAFTPMVQGAQAYFAWLNERGGVHGRTVELVTCDDRADRNGNLACVEQLLEEQDVFALVANTTLSYAGAKRVSDAGVPDVGGQPIGNEYFTYPTLFSIRGGQYPRDGEVGHDGRLYSGTTPYRHLKRELGLRHAAVFAYSVPQSQAYARFLAEALGREGYEVTTYEVSIALPSFDSQVADMQARGVDAIFDALDLTGNQNLCRSMERNAFAVKAKVSSTATWSRRVAEQFPEICKRSLLAIGESRSTSSEHPDVRTFRAAMSKAYGGQLDAALHVWHLEGWNAARLFTEGVASMGADVTRAGLLRWLEGFTADRGWGAGGTMVPQSWQPVDYDRQRTTRECNAIVRWDERARDFVALGGRFPVCDTVPWVGYTPAGG